MAKIVEANAPNARKFQDCIERSLPYIVRV